MEIETIRALRGPSVWGHATALEVTVDLAAHDGAIADLPGLEERLREGLPLLELRRSPQRGGAPGAASETISMAHALMCVTLAVQSRAGSTVSFGRVVPIPRTGKVKTVIEYREEAVGRRALDVAWAFLQAARDGAPYDIDAEIARIGSLDQEVRLGPSTGAIVRAAQARGIPHRRLNEASMVQLGWGKRQRRIVAAETDRTGAIAESIAQDKELTKTLLRAVGVPVPEGRPVRDAEDAWAAAQELGGPVVVKPQYGNHGRGVAVNLTTREQVVKAFAAALEEGSSILVERYVSGFDHRVLVIGGHMVAAAGRHPPLVTGDGVRTIAELVAIVNSDPRRGEDHATPLSRLRLDEIGLHVLAEQGYTPSSVPPAGELVLLRRNANLSTGGTATDMTDLVHPEVAALAEDAARVIGLDIAGVDMLCRDISRPLVEQGGAVVEVNAGPGLRMHIEPSSGQPRPVGEAIVDMLFPAGDDGRIPLVAVTGTNGKTTTVRLVAHILRRSGKHVGMTCSDGVYLDERRLESGDCSGPKSARNVLVNPSAEAAVLETARGGLLREGLAFDLCDVAVVTNIGAGDHLGLAGIDTVEQLAEVKRIPVENVAPHGSAVLNADDPLTGAMASACAGRVIFFARSPSNALVAAHRAGGGRAVFVRDGAIVLADGASETRLVAVDEIPITRGGRIGFQIENALAAAAATWALGIDLDVVRAGLSTFMNGTREVPGRFNVKEHAGATIIIDYGHNVDALLALVEAIDNLPSERRMIVISAAGDRRDEDIIGQGKIVGDAFDEAILFEDEAIRGRPVGEITAMLRSGIEGGRRTKSVTAIFEERPALEEGLRRLRPGDLLLLLVDQVETSIAFIETYLAEARVAAAMAAAPPLASTTSAPSTHQHN